MNAERWQRVGEVFDSAVTRDAAERAAFLADACGGDSDLRREVESLLAHRADAEPFLETPPLSDVRRLLDQNGPGALVGERVGAYRIVEMIASGGMGTVYLAARADDQYRKQVAIKIVRTGDRTPELVERFRIERQTLAGLEHANIARLIDGGITEENRPYYVMEFVEGRPIDQYCEVAKDGGLSTRERLELFCTVCEAVGYAHQNLVIHRDLKPSNILVTNDGIPKLVDFGLAKTLGNTLGDADGPTVQGEFIGTVAYAAPEQVKGDVGSVDTRTDVYALGVVLFRLLTGRSPYPSGGSLSDVLHHILETAPNPPSTYYRHGDDELDAIVLKALSKEKERRYQSAAALKEDIHRYLAGDPVLAKGESSWNWYVVKKTARRHRLPLAISAAFVVLVSAFAVVMTIQAGRVANQRDIAEKALRSNKIERGRAMGLAGNMTHAERLIWREYLAGAGVTGSPTSGPIGAGLSLDEAHWALWELYAHHPCVLTTTDPYNSRISAVALSPDGTSLASSGSGGVITWFDFPSGRQRPGFTTTGLHSDEPGKIVTNDSFYPRISFSPDGRFIGVGTQERTVELWNVETGRRAVVLGASEASVEPTAYTSGERAVFQSIVFFPDGRTIATSSGENVIRIWDVASKTCTRVLEGHGNHVRRLAISPDGRTLLSASADGLVMLWDVSTGRRVGMLQGPGQFINCVRFSPDGRHFAAVGNDLTVFLWETTPPHGRRLLTGHTAWVRAVAFHPRAPLLATGSGDNTVILWDIPTGRVIRRLAGHAREVVALCFAPDGRYLVSADWDSIKVWDVNERRHFRKLVGVTGPVFSAVFYPGGRRVAFCRSDEDRSVRICDRFTGEILHILKGHTAPVSSVAVSPDGTVLASASYDHTVRLWDAVTGSCKKVLTGHQGGINAVCFRDDGRAIASGSDDGTIRLWEVPSGRHLATLEQHSQRIPSVRFSPVDQTLAASTGRDGEIVLWDTATRRIRRRWKAHDIGVRPVRFSHDGRILASGGDDNQIRLWDPASGSCVGTLAGHDQHIFGLDFARGDHILASSSRGNTIKLWDIAEHRCLVTLEGHNDMVFSVQFSRDGRELVSASRDGIVGLWDLGYYDRHIAGNLAFQRTRLSGDPNGRIVKTRKTGRRLP
ncbi:MAG: protein kinase [Phycisphaerae bacterium]